MLAVRSRYGFATVALILSACAGRALADSPWLYGIHWYGDPASGNVETMTGGKGIWSLEVVETNSDIWWGAAWQRDNRFQTMVARGHTIIVRIERNWGETVPQPEHLAQYLLDVQAAAQALADVCHIWQIGNEMNLYAEWGGNQLTPAAYVDIYRQVRAAIKAVPSSLGEQIVLLGPVSPGDVEFGVRHTAGNDYLNQMCALLTPAEVDGFALHAYAAPWNDVLTSRYEFQMGYLSQLAVLNTRGFADQPVFITEWNRRVDPINNDNEAQSAQFLYGALADLHTWNQRPSAHPVTAACWFIYQYDSGGWANYSIEYLHGVGPTGSNNDLYDAFTYACTSDLPATVPTPSTPLMYAATPPGHKIAQQAASVHADSGNDVQLAFDGVISVASKWTSNGTLRPHWIQVDLGAPRPLSGYVVYHAGAAGEPSSYNTAAFYLETAPTANGPWQIDAMIYNAGSANSTARTYYEPRLTRLVRLYITDPGIDNYARIPEFEIYVAAPPGDYDHDGWVNAADWPYLSFCMDGPGQTYATGHLCLTGDADDDADIDLHDAASFQCLFGQWHASCAQSPPGTVIPSVDTVIPNADTVIPSAARNLRSDGTKPSAAPSVTPQVPTGTAHPTARQSQSADPVLSS